MTPQERRLRLDNMQAMEGGPWVVMHREWKEDVRDIINGFDTRPYPDGWALGTKLEDLRESGNDFRVSNLGEVLRIVCLVTGLSPEMIRGPRKSRRISWRRAIVAKVARDVCPQCSLPTIGKFLKRHHTTIMHAINALPCHLEKDPDLALEYDQCCRHFGLKP